MPFFLSKFFRSLNHLDFRMVFFPSQILYFYKLQLYRFYVGKDLIIL
jgi:hypothetical protein